MKKIIFSIFAIAFVVLSCDLTPPDTAHKIIYHGNGNSSGFPPTDSNEYRSGMEAVVLGIGTLGKEGYSFTHWNNNSNGTGDSYNPGDTIEITHSTVFLYAIWDN